MNINRLILYDSLLIYQTVTKRIVGSSSKYISRISCTNLLLSASRVTNTIFESADLKHFQIRIFRSVELSYTEPTIKIVNLGAFFRHQHPFTTIATITISANPIHMFITSFTIAHASDSVFATHSFYSRVHLQWKTAFSRRIFSDTIPIFKANVVNLVNPTINCAYLQFFLR